MRTIRVPRVFELVFGYTADRRKALKKAVPAIQSAGNPLRVSETKCIWPTKDGACQKSIAKHNHGWFCLDHDRVERSFRAVKGVAH